MRGFAAAFVSVVIALMTASAPAWASTRTDLDRDWQFRVDPDEFGDTKGWMSTIPADTQPVSIPNTWNIGPLHDYLGVAWYFHRFDLPTSGSDTHVQLHFGATFYKSRVWLNGVELGGHEGGYTAYSFDITPQLRATNLLAVRVDNRPDAATIPGFGARGALQAWYDWWTYGGIVRDVWLTSSGPAWISRQRIRSEKRGAGFTIRDRVYVQSTLAEGAPVRMRITAYGPDDRVAAMRTQSFALAAGATELELALKLDKPKLWGIDHPNVYRMAVELSDARGKPLDEQSDTFGVRTVEIRDRHLLINGERVRLTGLARHEDSPAEGLAESPATMQHDYDDLKRLHTTLSRPVHYPQNPYILDYADRHGILLIPEIPVWQFSEAQLSDPAVLALAQRQMREMIEQAGNHPSIFAWSVANESATGTPGGIAYFRAMRDMIRQIDPDRLVSFADDNLPKLEHAEQSAANDADFLMMNQYFGTWHGPTSALGPALDTVDRLFPGKMVIISEFGYPGPFASNPLEADRLRIQTIQQQLPILAARDWIAGAIMWCYQDYKSRRNLWPGQVEGFVEHGVVDEMRTHKPSFEVWRQLNSPASIEAQWVKAPDAKGAGFSATVTPNTERSLPYYALHHYRLDWTLVDEYGHSVASGERQFETLAVPEHITASVPHDRRGEALRLTLTLRDSSGSVAAERQLESPTVPIDSRQ
jgi:beta-glucuronidase